MREPRGGQIYKVACSDSPDSHGEHIKCSPARAELAIDLIYLSSPGLLASTPQLVLERVQRCREASTAMGKHGAGVGVHRHDGCTAKQAAVLDAVA